MRDRFFPSLNPVLSSKEKGNGGEGEKRRRGEGEERGEGEGEGEEGGEEEEGYLSLIIAFYNSPYLYL